MRGIKAIMMIPVAGVLLLAGACTGNAYDDGSAADVVLEVLGLTTPPVTAAVSTTGFCSMTPSVICTDDTDCPSPPGGGTDVCTLGGCTLQVVDWTASLSNVPKTSVAQAPANDIAMIDVTVSYAFPAASPAPRTFGLGGVVIPTGGSASVTFPPIALQDVQDPALQSTTAALTMNFRGQTLEGTIINLTVGENLTVEECQ